MFAALGRAPFVHRSTPTVSSIHFYASPTPTICNLWQPRENHATNHHLKVQLNYQANVITLLIPFVSRAMMDIIIDGSKADEMAL